MLRGLGLARARRALVLMRGWVRVLVAPIVLIAQVADVSCWWLARIDPTTLAILSLA